VMVAEAHRLVADALEILLVTECDVVGLVHDGLKALDGVRRLAPDVVLLGLSMPPPCGVDLIRQLRERAPSARLIVLTKNEDLVTAAATFRAGASGFVLKRCELSELMSAIREVMRSRSYLTPHVAGGVIKALLDSVRDADAERLTSRQLDVLRLLVGGRSMKEAASILNISVRTIAFHKYAMMERLRLRTTADLVRFAVQRSLC